MTAQPSQLESTLQSLRYLDKITNEVKARVDDIMGNKCALRPAVLCCCRAVDPLRAEFNVPDSDSARCVHP